MRRRWTTTSARWCASTPTAACRPTTRSSAAPGARPEIWSHGHRNVQGAALHPATGELWTNEHGPQGGDELNVVAAGRNYGWPLHHLRPQLRHRHAHRRRRPEGRHGAAAEVLGAASIAPSGMAFYTSDRYPGWKGSLFVGTLRGEALVRLDARRQQGGARGAPARARLNERIRDVRQGPDG